MRLDKYLARNFILRLFCKRATLHKFYYIIIVTMLNIIYFKLKLFKYQIVIVKLSIMRKIRLTYYIVKTVYCIDSPNQLGLSIESTLTRSRKNSINMRAMILQLKRWSVTMDLRVRKRKGDDCRRNPIASRNAALQNIVDRHPNPYGAAVCQVAGHVVFPELALAIHHRTLTSPPLFTPNRLDETHALSWQRMPGALFRPASFMIITALILEGTTLPLFAP